MQDPEVRSHLQSLQRRHYQHWPEIPLPALNGRTPLEAVGDRDGREMVEALVRRSLRRHGANPNGQLSQMRAAYAKGVWPSPCSDWWAVLGSNQ